MARHARLPWAPAAVNLSCPSRPNGLRGLSRLNLVRERRPWNMKWKRMSTRSHEISSIFIYKKINKVSAFLSGADMVQTKNQTPCRRCCRSFHLQRPPRKIGSARRRAPFLVESGGKWGVIAKMMLFIFVSIVFVNCSKQIIHRSYHFYNDI